MNKPAVVAVFAMFASAIIPFCVVATPSLGEGTVRKNAAVARRAATDGMVLLKNDGTLPLASGSPVALFGDFEAYRPGGGGSSKVKPIRTVTIPEGLEEAGFKIDAGSRATAVFVIGREARENADCTNASFDLSDDELATISKIKTVGFKKVVVVCNCGHAMNLKPIEEDSAVGAVLFVWYPGGEGGAAVGDILSGKVNPSGRLADTFAERVADYPSDRGYRESRWYVPKTFRGLSPIFRGLSPQPKRGQSPIPQGVSPHRLWGLSPELRRL